MTLVRIGRVGRPHGLNGQLLVDDCSLNADELRALRDVIWRGKDGTERTLVVESAKPMLAKLIVHFRGIDDRERARELVLGELSADASRLPDPGPGVAYAFQLIGLEVRTEDGRTLGRLESVMSTGAHPVFVVQGEREWLIPATEHVVKAVELDEGRITVSLPAGLEEV